VVLETGRGVSSLQLPSYHVTKRYVGGVNGYLLERLECMVVRCWSGLITNENRYWSVFSDGGFMVVSVISEVARIRFYMMIVRFHGEWFGRENSVDNGCHCEWL